MDERTLNDLLECSVCLDRLNLNSKVLPCQHTFCRKCLEIIVSSQGSLRCPECRVLVDMKIDELPPNVLLMRILEGMKNASHNQINTAISSQNPVPTMDNYTGINTHHQQQTNSSKLITNRPMDEQNIIRQQSSTSTKKIPCGLTTVPHAKALYDFVSKENGDISFKKGDDVILRKRVDMNWFVGEINGREGVFPINHVQVIVPLPQAQCIALYDFRMGPSEEEGCLSFKKGAIINVFRRVDHNWAEGRIGDAIGIFPIAFVELNPLAKTLMEIVPHAQFAQSTRTVPATPHIEQISSNDSSSTVSSPNSSPSITSSTSNTTTSSPTNNLCSLLTSAPKPHENKPNRHSMINVLKPSTNNQRVNRHSAEILSVPESEANSHLTKAESKPAASRHSDGSHKSSSSKVVTAVIPALPATYVALYPYKPQKSDELELKKGSIYFVTERCQDGWFKGSNRAHKSGVFPGNYVTPLRSTHREFNQISNQRRQEKQKASASNQSSNHKSVLPPELPPRSGTAYESVWCKPVGHVDSVFGRKSDAVTSGSSTNVPSSATCKDKRECPSSTSTAANLMKRIANIKRSKSPSSNTRAITYSMDNPVFEDISASPPPGPSSSNKRNIHMSHPVHVRSGSCPSQLLHSLPIDNHSSKSETTVNMFGSQRLKGHKERPSLHGMRNNFETHRLRGLTENVTDGVGHAEISTNTTATSHHRKSQSLDAATISSQIGTNSTKPNKSHHSSSLHKERFRCIVPYPPNSEFELELNVGDVVIVHKKRDNGWFKGSLARTGKMGLFPASFVEPEK